MAKGPKFRGELVKQKLPLVLGRGRCEASVERNSQRGVALATNGMASTVAGKGATARGPTGNNCMHGGRIVVHH